MYKPEFSLWLDTNNRPVIKGADDGIWDRIRLVPFTVRIPDVLPASRLKGNEQVLAEFRTEMPGILNWALAGLAAFRRGGLGVAQAVEAAGKEYRADSDLLGEFLSAHYAANTAGQTPVDAVYQAYQNWCGRSGLTAMSKVALCRELRERGWTDKRMKIAGHTALCWLGITSTAAGGAAAVCTKHSVRLRRNSLPAPKHGGSGPRFCWRGPAHLILACAGAWCRPSRSAGRFGMPRVKEVSGCARADGSCSGAACPLCFYRLPGY